MTGRQDPKKTTGPTGPSRQELDGPDPGRGPHIRDRLTCTIKTACEVSGMGRTKFYELIRSGEISVISIGRRRLVQVPTLLKALKMDRP